MSTPPPPLRLGLTLRPATHPPVVSLLFLSQLSPALLVPVPAPARHTPVAEPDIRLNRVNCDTGAFKTGVLTALVIEGAEKRFLQARDHSALTP